MGTQEWILLALVLVIPLLIAVVVTLWTLEQAIKRNKKNRGGKTVRRAAEPVAEPEPSAVSSQQSAVSSQHENDNLADR